MQALGHADPKMFDKAYRSQVVRWDIQNTFLGHKNRMSVVLAAGDTARSRDPYAPNRLSEKQHRDILDLPEIMQLQQARQALVDECTKGYGSIIEAERQGAEVASRLQKAVQAHRTEVRRQRTRALKEIRDEWFKSGGEKSYNDDDNENEEDGSEDSIPTIPRKVPHTVPERASLAKLLFEPFSTTEDATKRRLEAISLMSQLCSRREPKQITFPLALKRLSEERLRSSEKRYTPRCEPRTCLFCLARQDDRVLSTYVRLSKHLEKVHYRYLPKNRSFKCPHPDCDEMLQHVHHFQMHATSVHGIKLTKKCGRSDQSLWGNQDSNAATVQ